MRYCLIACLFFSSLFAEKASSNQPPADCGSRSPYSYYDATMFSPYLFASWIYWQPVMESPMNWEFKDGFINDPTIDPQYETDSFQTESIKYPFSSGFKVGLGYRIGENAYAKPTRPWQIQGVYTRLVASETSRNTAAGASGSPGAFETEEYVFPAVPYTRGGNFTSSRSHAVLNYNVLDVNFAWPMWLEGDIIFRLNTGATFGWIKNTWNSSWSRTIDPISTETDLMWKWWGGGLSGGGDIYLPIGLGLGFIADGGFGLLYGRMNEKETYQANSATVTEFNASTYRFHSFQPEVRFSAGLDYKRWFGRRVMVNLSASWEFTWWFNLNQCGMVNNNCYYVTAPVSREGRFFNTEPSGLGFQGLTLRGGLDF